MSLAGLVHANRLLQPFLAIYLFACVGPLPEDSTLAGSEAIRNDTAPALPAPDILERLKGVSGITVVGEEPAVVSGYRFIRLKIDQPVDHKRPSGPRFQQVVDLLHRAEDAPFVLNSTGYGIALSDFPTEVTNVLKGNQVTVEHRYFGASRPEPPTWENLDIAQAAADHHRVVELLKPIYRGRWISTGISKGGMTSVFHRRFYPDDVEATVAYVSPIIDGSADPRFSAFLERVGDATCRAALKSFQRAVLTDRAAIVQAMTAHGAASQLTFDRLGADKALEHMVIELPFNFWQSSAGTDCPAIPAAGAPAQTKFEFLNRYSTAYQVSDTAVTDMEPFAYQTGTELGFPALDESAVSQLLRYPGSYTRATYAPRGVALVFDPKPMRDVTSWIKTQGKRLMFIYGENDPWYAGAVELGSAQDSYRYVVPGGSHMANLRGLPEPAKGEALARLRAWANIAGPPSPLGEGD